MTSPVEIVASNSFGFNFTEPLSVSSTDDLVLWLNYDLTDTVWIGPSGQQPSQTYTPWSCTAEGGFNYCAIMPQYVLTISLASSGNTTTS